MKALVTGGGGFLGSCLCRMLRAAGHDVVAVGRSDYPGLRADGIQCVQADVAERGALDPFCQGRDVVFHVAAVAGVWGSRREFHRTNIEGTRHVIEACRKYGVARLVYTSSPSVVFGEGDLCGVDERQPYPPRYVADYPYTKAVAERLVLDASDAELGTVSLRPHLIWGPGDPHLIPRVVNRARRGRLRIVGDGRNRVDIVYVDNAARAHILAAEALAESGRCTGRAYFISQGQAVELWPWLNALLARLDVPPIRRSMSYRAAYRVGAVCEWAYRIGRFKGEPPMTRFLAGQLAKSHYFDISAARRDLGYEPEVSTAEGLDRLVAALRAAPDRHL